jgi:hypothetical protein
LSLVLRCLFQPICQSYRYQVLYTLLYGQCRAVRVHGVVWPFKLQGWVKNHHFFEPELKLEKNELRKVQFSSDEIL